MSNLSAGVIPLKNGIQYDASASHMSHMLRKCAALDTGSGAGMTGVVME